MQILDPESMGRLVNLDLPPYYLQITSPPPGLLKETLPAA